MPANQGRTELTFLMSLVRPGEGVWQSVDMRVTNGRDVDDQAPKQVHVQCVDGTLLLAFTGLAEAEGLRLTDWIRETLRGEHRTIEGHFAHLIERANRDIANGPLRGNGLIIHGVAMHGTGLHPDPSNVPPQPGTPYVFETSNLQRHPDGSQSVTDNFTYSAFCVEEPMFLAGGSGLGGLQSEDHDLIQRAIRYRPKHIKDYNGLLATLNRRVASRVPSVSPWCRTVYMPTTGVPLRGRLHLDPSNAAPERPAMVPGLAFGIDFTDMMDLMSLARRQRVTDAGLNEAIRRGLEPRP